jgi:putative transposase
MARTQRRDAPGRFHHIMNRASRRQVLFADRRDYRYFMSLLARAVRRGELVIQAYCLLGTHFHLLAASPDGQISYAMMRIQNAYARYRNRRSRQDGPLFRGRFRSKPVTSRLYWWTLIRYIDQNPVRSGLCGHPFEYAYGSARHHLGPRGPRWLDRAGVAAAIAEVAHPNEGCGSAYARAFGAPITQAEVGIIERRMARPGVVEDELDELFRAPPDYLARWMARKVRASGGRSPWIPIASPAAVQSALCSLRQEAGAWSVRCGRNEHDGWALLGSGLLNALACLSTDDAALLLECHPATVARRVQRHKQLLGTSEEYAARAGVAARSALDATFTRR